MSLPLPRESSLVSSDHLTESMCHLFSSMTPRHSEAPSSRAWAGVTVLGKYEMTTHQDKPVSVVKLHEMSQAC